MAFNHYAKIKRILADQPDSWYIRRIDEQTSAKNFRGETNQNDQYYRIYDRQDNQIKYCKFQKIDKLAHILGKSVEDLPIIQD